MPYWQLYYHLVWSTKDRQPLLTSALEPVVHNLLWRKAVGLGATVFALNGTADHVHLVAAIPPKLAVATFVGQVKGVASARLNQMAPESEPFYWQAEYGAFSFDRKRLPSVVAYVERQKEHHAARTTIPILERWEDVDGGVVREEMEMYVVEDAGWRREMEGLG